MITLLIQSYGMVFLSIGIVCLCIFIFGIYWIFRSAPLPLKHETDLSSIAGDDVISTQLDLARAYIETNNKLIAKNILKLVMTEGNKAQKEEAKALLGMI